MINQSLIGNPGVSYLSLRKYNKKKNFKNILIQTKDNKLL